MSEIRVKENESLESALKRFKRSCQKDGVIAEVRVGGFLCCFLVVFAIE